MLNPGANHLPGFRRSTTCHAVRRWGLAHGYDGAIYVNLFTHIEPNSSRLRAVAPGRLNGPSGRIAGTPAGLAGSAADCGVDGALLPGGALGVGQAED